MVRNKTGGKHGKALARKLLTNDTNIRRIVRKPECELEVFAAVTKMFGTMCEVITSDDKIYKCHIRGKFRGRAKRNCIIAVGKIILVGFREFEKPNYKNCDLLEVYEQNEINELQKIPGIDIGRLIVHTLSHTDSTSKDMNPSDVNYICFSNDVIDEEDKERVKLMKQENEKDDEDFTEKIKTDDGEYISFDDI